MLLHMKQLLIEIDEDRALHWLRVGAQPSDTVRVLMGKVGIWQRFEADKQARRAAKAERS